MFSAATGVLSGLRTTPKPVTAPIADGITTAFPVCQPIKTPLEREACSDLLPYNDARFPNTFASDSIVADMLIGGLLSGLASCGDAVKLMSCYMFFQPCDSAEPKLCREVCEDVKQYCPGMCHMWW